MKDNSDDETIDTEDTSHDNRDQGLEYKVWLRDTHSGDADSRSCSSVSSAKVAEDQSGCDSHEAEKRVQIGIIY